MLQQKFYDFRKKCSKGVVVNKRYEVSTEELMDAISNIVIKLKEINEYAWEIELEEVIIDNKKKIYIERI